MKLKHANFADLVYTNRKRWMENQNEPEDARWAALRALRGIAEDYAFQNMDSKTDRDEFRQRAGLNGE